MNSENGDKPADETANAETPSLLNGVEARQLGRPTKRNEETISRLCDALAAGLPLKSACALANIGVQTLGDWRSDDPELESRIASARERFRQKALQTIGKAIDDGDWRAAAKALEMIFPEYRGNANKIEVNATANASTFVLSVERQRELQERKARALEGV